MKRSGWWVLATLIALVGWWSRPGEAKRGQVDYRALNALRIYAYRDWQSTGVRIGQGDLVSLEAEGVWLYTPEEYHGPEGHRIYVAPSFYPLPGARGGALIGRIGEEGQPFYVGKRTRWYATEAGTLYLRIDDDILSDNEGYVEIDLEVTPAEE